MKFKAAILVKSQSPLILEDIEINIVNWEKSPPFKHEDKMLVKILNKDKSNRDSTTRIKEKLLADGFKWIPNASSWQKIINDRKQFNISILQRERAGVKVQMVLK